MKKKLEVGAGNMPVRAGSVAVDVYTPKWASKTPERFFLCDVEHAELPFSDETFDEVVLKHVLEHFNEKARVDVIKKCLRVLKQGGELRIMVPNTDRYIERYVSGIWGMEQLSKMLFGAQGEVWCSENAHKVCYNLTSLKNFFDGFANELLLVDAGLGNRGRWNDAKMEIRMKYKRIKG